MRILVTGAFGNVGISTLEALRSKGHQLRCFDVPTPLNKKTAAIVAASTIENCEVVWGDLRDARVVSEAVAGCDVILHLAAIIPPLSERAVDLAKSVNVDGTRNLIQAAEAQANPPRFLFASSISVHGHDRDHSKLCRPDDTLRPTDHYTHHKVECEGLLVRSKLTWSILRLAAVMPLKLGQIDPIMFEIDLASQVEFVHTRDVGLAFANAVDSTAVNGKILLIGGGKQSQMLYREFYARILGAMGVGMLPAEAFSRNPFYTDWMDTSESQTLLQYQTRSFQEYVDEMIQIAGWRRPAASLFRPLAQRWILRYSPYYGNAKTANANVTGIPVEGPSLIVWLLVLGGMALTGILAYNHSAFALWSENITTLLTPVILQTIFVVAVFLHVAEALIAFRLAQRGGTARQVWGWFAQTFLLGYFSLGILRGKLAGKAKALDTVH